MRVDIGAKLSVIDRGQVCKCFLELCGGDEHAADNRRQTANRHAMASDHERFTGAKLAHDRRTVVPQMPLTDRPFHATYFSKKYRLQQFVRIKRLHWVIPPLTLMRYRTRFRFARLGNQFALWMLEAEDAKTSRGKRPLHAHISVAGAYTSSKVFKLCRPQGRER